MTYMQKFSAILRGLITLIIAAVMLIVGSDSYVFVLLFLTLSLSIAGIKTLIYYFTMAKYMVGGRLVLYKGVILVDFAFLTFSFADIPKVYILIYLALVHAFQGLVEILRAKEAHLYGAKSWWKNLAHGLVSIALAVCCIIFVRNQSTAVIIYSLGLMYTAITYIAAGFKKTTLVYIQ